MRFLLERSGSLNHLPPSISLARTKAKTVHDPRQARKCDESVHLMSDKLQFVENGKTNYGKLKFAGQAMLESFADDDADKADRR